MIYVTKCLNFQKLQHKKEFKNVNKRVVKINQMK